MGLTRTTAPGKLAVTLDEARKQVEVVGGHHDAHLTRLIKAATAQAEKYTGRAFISQVWQLTLDAFPDYAIRLPRPPAISVDSITYVDADGDTQTLDSSTYRADLTRSPAEITTAYGETWPSTRPVSAAVTVTYTAGYGTNWASVPEEARQAIVLLVAEWFAHREPNVEGAQPKPLPLSATWLLDSLKVGAIAGFYGME